MKYARALTQNLYTFASALLAALLVPFGFASADPGIGGSGGGPRVGQVVTVQVCDGGEAGDLCRMVTYRVRPASKPEPVKCMVPHGEAGEVPCPEKVGVPGWLKRLNESFQTNSVKVEYVGGP